MTIPAEALVEVELSDRAPGDGTARDHDPAKVDVFAIQLDLLAAFVSEQGDRLLDRLARPDHRDEVADL